MACLCCREWGREPVCRTCRASLRPGGTQRLGSGLVVRSALAHDGAARLVVHRLKYEGMAAAADVLSVAMAPLVPSTATCLVPVPRVAWRRVRYGIDPAAAVAAALSKRTGLPVARVLSAAMVGPIHAGRSRSARPVPIFRARGPVPREAVLVDDVVTTGVTLAAAAAALGASGVSALTGTAALR